VHARVGNALLILWRHDRIGPCLPGYERREGVRVWTASWGEMERWELMRVMGGRMRKSG
jgi:hypothetical protein